MLRNLFKSRHKSEGKFIFPKEVCDYEMFFIMGVEFYKYECAYKGLSNSCRLMSQGILGPVEQSLKRFLSDLIFTASFTAPSHFLS